MRRLGNIVVAVVKFAPVIRRARFAVPGFSPQAMLGFAQRVDANIKERMLRGQTVYDTLAPPLSERYGKYKQARYGTSIRDMRATGRTFRGIKVLEASTNKAKIGFTDQIAAFRIRINRVRSVQWGMSDANRIFFRQIVHDSLVRPVVVEQEKAG